MSSVCFSNRYDTLPDIAKREYSDLNLEERIKEIERLNPQLPQNKAISPNTAILLPPLSESKISSIEAKTSINLLNSCSSKTKNIIAEISTNKEEAATFMAISELIDDYGLLSASGDLNTYGSAALGNALTRSSEIYNHIRKIDEALVTLRNTPAGSRGPIKIQIKNLYRSLHNKFGVEISKILARNSNKIRKGHPLVNSQRGINMALGRSRQLPLISTKSVKSMTKFASTGKIVGKGLLVLDLTMRGTTVYDSYLDGKNWQREFFGQTAGLLASVYIGSIAFSLLLGPAGVIIAILFAGAGAIAADYFTRGLAYKVYDASSYLQHYLQPPFVY